jgi:hypothetical protein
MLPAQAAVTPRMVETRAGARSLNGKLVCAESLLLTDDQAPHDAAGGSAAVAATTSPRTLNKQRLCCVPL